MLLIGYIMRGKSSPQFYTTYSLGIQIRIRVVPESVLFDARTTSDLQGQRGITISSA